MMELLSRISLSKDNIRCENPTNLPTHPLTKQNKNELKPVVTKNDNAQDVNQ